MADAFGRMVADYHAGSLVEQPLHRRDDGETWDAVVEWYFEPPSEWSAAERDHLDRASGRVLDLGCGPGRIAQYLQRRGHEVVGADRSHLALSVARDCGVDHVVVSDLADGVRGPFDTVVVIGGQLGIPGSPTGLRDLLGDLGVIAPGGRLVADLFDPTAVEDADRQDYLRDRRVADGVSTRRFRVEYDGIEGPWIDLLYLSPDAFRDVVEATPWSVDAIHETDAERYFVDLVMG